MGRMAEGALIKVVRKQQQRSSPVERTLLKQRSRFFLAVAAGLLTTASVPPFGWWPLAIVGLGLLPMALEGTGRRARFWLGLAFAAGLYVPSLWWMTQFSLPGALVISGIEMTGGAFAGKTVTSNFPAAGYADGGTVFTSKYSSSNSAASR